MWRLRNRITTRNDNMAAAEIKVSIEDLPKVKKVIDFASRKMKLADKMAEGLEGLLDSLIDVGDDRSPVTGEQYSDVRKAIKTLKRYREFK